MAEETLTRVGGVLKAIGVTRIANVTGLDRIGIPVVMVCRPNARSLAVAQGKGLTLHAAKASGVMEAIERYHAEHILLPLKFATFEELRYTHPVAEPTSLRATAFFHDYRQIPWVEGRDLMSDQPFWVPYELIHTNFTLPFPTGSGAFTMSSTGVAAGNHMLEAVSHGICEVVERHSTAIWRRLEPDAQKRTCVDLDTVDAVACRALLDLYENADVAVRVWDTTAIGIASFLCTVADKSDILPGGSPVCSGMGCHPNRETALLRALTEAAQSRLTLIAGSRDDLSRSDYNMACDSDLLRSVREGSEEHGVTHRYQDVPSCDAECIRDDVEWELDCLDAAGFQNVIFVDLRRQEFMIPVVRIVIPGCERDPAHETRPRAKQRGAAR